MMRTLPTISQRIVRASVSERSVHDAFTGALLGLDLPDGAEALSVSVGDGIWDYLAFRTLPACRSIAAVDIVPCPVAEEDAASIRALGAWSYTQVEPDVPLPFPDRHFDMVFHHDTIEHTRKPFLMLSEQYRLLRPGGYLVFSTPNLLRPANVLKHITGRLAFPVRIGHNAEIGDYIHIQEFTRWQLRTMVEEAGFELIDEHDCYFGLHFLGICFRAHPRSAVGRAFAQAIQLTCRKR